MKKLGLLLFSLIFFFISSKYVYADISSFSASGFYLDRFITTGSPWQYFYKFNMSDFSPALPAGVCTLLAQGYNSLSYGIVLLDSQGHLIAQNGDIPGPNPDLQIIFGPDCSQMPVFKFSLNGRPDNSSQLIDGNDYYFEIRQRNSSNNYTGVVWKSNNVTYYESSGSNQAPIINSINSQTINEGDTYTASVNFTDPDSQSWTASVDYGDNSGVQTLTSNTTSFNLNHLYQQNGSYTINITITDNQGASSSQATLVTVNNLAPVVYMISSSTVPVLLGTSINATANFFDPGVLDTHTASWDWGDGTTTAGTVSESLGAGSVNDSHTYLQTGVYEITLTVTDNDGASGSRTYQYISIYNPTSQGLFSAGQKFNSPTGAFLSNSSLTGRVKFGLSYKYKESDSVGHRQFNMDFDEADLHFDGNTVTSMVISNNIGTLRGSGTINKAGTYSFMVVGNSQTDTIRIQIKDLTGKVIYDTQPDASDTSNPTTPVSAGNVLVH